MENEQREKEVSSTPNGGRGEIVEVDVAIDMALGMANSSTHKVLEENINNAKKVRRVLI